MNSQQSPKPFAILAGAISPTSSVPVDLGYTFGEFAVQLLINSGSLSSFSGTLLGSLDGVKFYALGTSILTTFDGQLTFYSGYPVRFVQFRLDTITGSNPNISIMVAPYTGGSAGINGPANLASAIQGSAGGYPVAVTASSLPLPTGAATVTNQNTEIVLLTDLVDELTPVSGLSKSYTYNGDGSIHTITHCNGVVETRAYDGNGNLTGKSFV